MKCGDHQPRQLTRHFWKKNTLKTYAFAMSLKAADKAPQESLLKKAEGVAEGPGNNLIQ